MPATTSRALLDVNALIASTFEDHPSHARARDFCVGLIEFCTTPTTQGGFLRFASRPWRDGTVLHPARLSMSAASDTLRAIVRMPSHRFLADDVSYSEVGLDRLLGHRQWTDAYLLHVARKHGIKLATFDEGIVHLAAHPDDAVHVIQ